MDTYLLDTDVSLQISVTATAFKLANIYRNKNRYSDEEVGEKETRQ